MQRDSDWDETDIFLPLHLFVHSHLSNLTLIPGNTLTTLCCSLLLNIWLFDFHKVRRVLVCLSLSLAGHNRCTQPYPLDQHTHTQSFRDIKTRWERERAALRVVMVPQSDRYQLWRTGLPSCASRGTWLKWVCVPRNVVVSLLTRACPSFDVPRSLHHSLSPRLVVWYVWLAKRSKRLSTPRAHRLVRVSSLFHLIIISWRQGNNNNNKDNDDNV